MHMLSRRFNRYAVAGAAALGLTLTIGGVGLASSGDSANPGVRPLTRAQVLVSSPAMAPGSEKKFVAVAQCRIIDTRVSGAGGPLKHRTRTFTADGPYTAQGGHAAGCGIPTTGVTAVLVNVGVRSFAGAAGFVKGWAAGTTKPAGSLLFYNKSGPTANMVTLPVNANGDFKLQTDGKANLFVDIAGYFVQPLYAAVSSGGAVYAGISSGVTSVTRLSAGLYDVSFNRNVQKCGATTASITWSSSLDVSPDVGAGADANTVRVGIVDPGGTFTDGYFTLSLTC
jgi:hypothetical protein